MDRIWIKRGGVFKQVKSRDFNRKWKALGYQIQPPKPVEKPAPEKPAPEKSAPKAEKGKK